MVKAGLWFVRRQRETKEFQKCHCGEHIRFHSM